MSPVSLLSALLPDRNHAAVLCPPGDLQSCSVPQQDCDGLDGQPGVTNVAHCDAISHFSSAPRTCCGQHLQKPV